MIFEELKCKNAQQTIHDATQLVLYGAKQSDDVTQLIKYSSSQSKSALSRGTSQFICSNEIASIPLDASNQDARNINWSSAIAELQSAHLTNNNTKQPYRHFVVSLAEGEQLPHQQWKASISKLMKHLGYENARYIAYKHSDTNNEHVHIVVSTTNLLTGKIISNWQSHLNAQPIMRELEIELGLQQVLSSNELNTCYGNDAKNGKEQTIKRMMRRKVEQAIKRLPPHASLIQFSTALLREGIEIELVANSDGSKFKGLAYRFHKFRFAASSLRSGNKYTLGKLVKNGILNENALDTRFYDPDNFQVRSAQAKFESIRRQSIELANEFKIQLKSHQEDQFRYLILTCARGHAKAMQTQADYWLYHSKFLRDLWERAFVHCLYESEKGLYKAANFLSDFFFHILLTLFEESLRNKWELRVVVTNDPTEKHRELKYGKQNDHSGLTR
ncbi:relaxase/mobilization nuclease domain-containing protein [Vibrio sinensis]|nr:relaxase/mobilization nuclease domain-containing protein [Vibrio sinensis]